MGTIIATDFDMSEIPWRGPNSKYHPFREQLFLSGKLKLEVANPDGGTLSRGQKHEGARIYNSLYQDIRRHLPQKILRGAIEGNTLWLWLEDRE